MTIGQSLLLATQSGAVQLDKSLFSVVFSNFISQLPSIKLFNVSVLFSHNYNRQSASST